jgi:excisionase family DNA binding protein
MKKTKQPRIEPAEMVDEPFINKAEVGRRLGIKPRTTDAWLSQKILPFYRIGRRAVRFRWSEVQAHLAATCRVIKEQ